MTSISGMISILAFRVERRGSSLYKRNFEIPIRLCVTLEPASQRGTSRNGFN